MKHFLLVAACVIVAGFGCAIAAQAAAPPTNPCSVVTRADASAALGVQAPMGFAVGSNHTNVSLGGAVTGPKIECRYLTSVGSVDVTIRRYADANAVYARDHRSWFPVVDLSGIGNAAFYIGGSAIEGRKGDVIFYVSLNFKKKIANPRSPYPQLVTLARIAASRL